MFFVLITAFSYVVLFFFFKYVVLSCLPNCLIKKMLALAEFVHCFIARCAYNSQHRVTEGANVWQLIIICGIVVMNWLLNTINHPSRTMPHTSFEKEPNYKHKIALNFSFSIIFLLSAGIKDTHYRAWVLPTPCIWACIWNQCYNLLLITNFFSPPHVHCPVFSLSFILAIEIHSKSWYFSQGSICPWGTVAIFFIEHDHLLPPSPLR